MTTITDKKQYPGEQYLNELITNIEFAARAPVEVVRAMAAELQKRREADSAEPVSQTYKLTFEQWLEQQHGKIDIDCGCVSTETLMHWMRVAYEAGNSPVIPGEVLSAIMKVARARADFDDFDGDRRGIGDCLDEAEQELIVTINKYASQLAVVPVGLDERAAFNAWNNDENLPIAGVGAKNAAWLAWQARAELGRSLAVNSPVTPDSWISCSERMPDTKTAVLVAVEFGRKGDWRMKWATYIPGHPDANDGWIIPGASWKPSHWMPLPEPPQGVNRG